MQHLALLPANGNCSMTFGVMESFMVQPLRHSMQCSPFGEFGRSMFAMIVSAQQHLRLLDVYSITPRLPRFTTQDWLIILTMISLLGR
jgi:hypothetical protein